MIELVVKNFKDMIVLCLITISIVILAIMDGEISSSFRQFLYGFIGMCIGYLFK